MTILDYFLKWEEESPEAIFLKQPKGNDWMEYSWSNVGAEARALLGALQSEGLEKGDRVAILSANCAQWIICDLALMMGGYVSVPLYANVNVRTMRSILKDSGARFLFVGKLASKDWLQLEKGIPGTLPTVAMEGYEKENIRSWRSFLEAGLDPKPNVSNPDETMTIIYTSGTTGDPKGVVHTHRSIMNAVVTAADEVELNRPGNRFLSYLPLSHAAERGLIESGGIYCGGTIAFVESTGTFAANMRDIAPTHFFGVPRIWEKFHEKILERIPQSRLTWLLAIPIVAGIVRLKIKQSLGLQNACVILSGAAPISPELIHWFQKLGIVIREGYGLSENFNVIAMNPKGAIRIGTVGKLFDNQEVRIDPETKEILQKCDWLMQGYYNKPTLTAQTIVNGFLHTGDMGSLSRDGYLTLIGRVKDIFKTAKGEYISPAVLELEFLKLPSVDQACVLGTLYPQPFVLIVLSNAGARMEKRKLEAELMVIIDQLNSGAMQYQKLKKAIIVQEAWTIDNELLTPTLKMKRNRISEKYESSLKPIYETDEIVSWEYQRI